MTRIVVAGGRDFDDYQYLADSLDSVLSSANDDIEFVSGHAKGADSLGERYATEHDIPVTVMKPDWKKYGRGAGVVRNQQMLDYACEATPLVIAFWDGLSKGTKDTISRSKANKIELQIFRY